MQRLKLFPETMIGANVEFYMRHLMGSGSTILDAFTDEAFAKYLQRFQKLEIIHESCEECHAISLELKHHAVDPDKRASCPLLALWGGSRGIHPDWSTNVVDPLTAWREHCEDTHDEPIHCGHFLPEERLPGALQEITYFLAEG